MHRMVAWRLLSALGIEYAARIPGLPFQMILEPQFRSVGSLGPFCLGDRYESMLRHLPAIMRPGDVAFDCGANQGLYALWLAHLVGPTGRVLAVEAQAYAAHRVRLNAMLNRFTQLETVEAAISDRVGTAEFGIGPERVSAGLGKALEERIEVPTVTIDALAEGIAPGRIRFVKLDVEGAESAAIDGGQRTLRDHAPHILYETFDEDGLLIYGKLRALGYRLFEVTPAGLVPLGDGRRSGFEFLAVHERRLGELGSLAPRAG
jgi:FkbM family methyltransferase